MRRRRAPRFLPRTGCGATRPSSARSAPTSPPPLAVGRPAVRHEPPPAPPRTGRRGGGAGSSPPWRSPPAWSAPWSRSPGSPCWARTRTRTAPARPRSLPARRPCRCGPRPTLSAAGGIAPSVARIVVRAGNRWITGAGTLVDAHGSVVTAASLVTGASVMRVHVRGRPVPAGHVGGHGQEAPAWPWSTSTTPASSPCAWPTSRRPSGSGSPWSTGPTDDSSSGRMYLGQVSTRGRRGAHHRLACSTAWSRSTVRCLPDHDGCAVADPAGRLVGVEPHRGPERRPGWGRPRRRGRRRHRRTW